MILDVQYMCITFSRMVDVPYLYSPHFFYKESSSSSTCTCIYTTCILLLQYVFVKYFISDLDLDIFPLISLSDIVSFNELSYDTEKYRSV